MARTHPESLLVKILLVTANFAAPGINPWLLDDLVSAFLAAGHSVDVVVNSPTAARPSGIDDSRPGLRVLSIGATSAPAGTFAKAVAYAATGIQLHTKGWRFVRHEEYDLCVYTSIAAFDYAFPGRVRRAGIAKRLLFVMWDFFPIHQLEIGRIRLSGVGAPLRRIERAAIAPADVLAVMSPANESFMRGYHPGLTGEYVVIPPWASDAPSGSVASDKFQNFTVLFGGQLAKGRGVDTLLQAAAILKSRQSRIDIQIAGAGPDEAALKSLAAQLNTTNVTFAGQLDRETYRSLLRRVHVGIAVTVPGVSVPSFPSKIVEYCANGLPVIVSVEPTSDAGDLIEGRGAGLVTAAGDAQQLADAIARLSTEHTAGTLNDRGIAARRLFHTDFSVTVAARRMVDAAESSR